MERNLDTLKEVLWQQFEKAHGKQERYDTNEDGYSTDKHPSNFAIQGRQTLATLALGITAIETEQRAQDALKPHVVDKPNFARKA